MTFEPKTSFESVRRCTYAASRSFKNSKSKADLKLLAFFASLFLCFSTLVFFILLDYVELNHGYGAEHLFAASQPHGGKIQMA